MFERFTDRARRVVVLAQEEARTLNHDYIGTEHLLLGLIHEGEGVGAQVLTGLNADLDTVRERVVELVRGHQGKELPGLRSGKGGRVKRRMLAEILAHVQSIDSRLSAVEQRVGIGPDLSDL